MARRLLAVVALVSSALAVSCGGKEPSEQRSAKTPRAAPVTSGPGRMVEIGGGRSLYLQCVGSGGRFGRSVARPGVHDARDEIADLQRLLDSARIEPPYVLVGHSYGGVLARVFAALHPTETAGLVLIDTMGRDGRRRHPAIWPRSQARGIRDQVATTVMSGVDLAAGEALASRIRTLGETPLAIVTAGRQDNFPRTPARLGRALRRLWNTLQDELAGLSDNSVHVVALESNHDVPALHGGQPPVVIRAVQAVVRAARDHARLPPCRRLFSGSDVRCPS